MHQFLDRRGASVASRTASSRPARYRPNNVDLVDVRVDLDPRLAHARAAWSVVTPSRSAGARPHPQHLGQLVSGSSSRCPRVHSGKSHSGQLPLRPACRRTAGVLAGDLDAAPRREDRRSGDAALDDEVSVGQQALHSGSAIQSVVFIPGVDSRWSEDGSALRIPGLASKTGRVVGRPDLAASGRGHARARAGGSHAQRVGPSEYVAISGVLHAVLGHRVRLQDDPAGWPRPSPAPSRRPGTPRRAERRVVPGRPAQQGRPPGSRPPRRGCCRPRRAAGPLARRAR